MSSDSQSMLSWANLVVAAVAAVPGFITALLPRKKLKIEIESIKKDAERLSRNQRILVGVVLQGSTANSHSLIELAVDTKSYIKGNH